MIEFQNVARAFTSERHTTAALDDVTFRVDRHEFVCLVGPSGCGKTTVLRLVAGLIFPDAGRVLINGLPVAGPGPDRAIVFQDAALLPWSDVLTSVAFGLELRGVPRAEREARAWELIRAVGLEGFERHHPRQLSGGMQQRVGLARALAVDPDLLLMDEPFAAVDAQTRRGLQDELLRLQAATRKTVLFVTHDIDEAVRLGDRVLVMSERPGHIRESVPVTLPRPHSPDLDLDPAAMQIKSYLWRRLEPWRG